MNRPLIIIAHRGEPGRRENTVAGFLAGVRRGAEWVELDVHCTTDGAIVVHHDFTIDGRPITRLTLKQAKQQARRSKHIALPTLEDVMEAVPERIGLGIEIKAPGIGAAVLRVLTRHRAVGRALVSSFHWPTIRALAERTLCARSTRWPTARSCAPCTAPASRFTSGRRTPPPTCGEWWRWASTASSPTTPPASGACSGATRVL